MAKNDTVTGWGTNWSNLLLWGFLLIILGLFAISLATFTTFLSVIFIGAILLISGVVVLIDSFRFRQISWGSFLLHLLMGVLYVIVGVTLIVDPLAGSVSLTFLLGILYVTLGIFRIVYSIGLKGSQWRWSLLSGILSLILGLLILANWPAASLFVIGLFVGIDLLVWGWTYVLISLTGRGIIRE